MVNFLNMDPEILRYIGIIALGFFLLFVISKILALNDNLLQGAMGIKEGFADKGTMDRSKMDHESVMSALKETHKKYIRRLRLPEDKEKIMDELDEYLENIKLEEVLTLNWMMWGSKYNTKSADNYLLGTLAKNLDAYKHIREAIDRVEL